MVKVIKSNAEFIELESNSKPGDKLVWLRGGLFDHQYVHVFRENLRYYEFPVGYVQKYQNSKNFR